MMKWLTRLGTSSKRIFLMFRYKLIKVAGMEQLLRYAVILLDYADESKQEFDVLLIERNRYGAIWLHFAVRPKDNRRKISFINA
jgi:hypothetical protein